MSGKIPALPPVAPEPTKAAPKPPPPETAAAPRPAEHRSASTLSPADISYVDGLLGIAPPQVMEYILLKTGIPQPANLGQDLDTSA